MSDAVIFIVDDDDAMRDSLSELLQAAGFRVRDFPSAKAFLAALAEAPACAIVDIRMPEMDGLELQGELVRRGNALPIIFVTGHGDVPLAVRAMQAGAVDFLEKPYDDELLLKSVQRALELHARQRQAGVQTEESLRKYESLTAREKEVLAELVQGHPNKIIAHHLGISPRTVEIYRANVMEKMGVRSLSELVRLALGAGLGGVT